MNYNAFIGRNVEILFKNSVGDNPIAMSAIQQHFMIEGRYLNSVSTGIHSEKCDVKMEFADGHNIDANVKAYKRSAAFNQLTRASIPHFCTLFGLEYAQKDLANLFLTKARNDRTHLFPPEAQSLWRLIFQEVATELVYWSLSSKKSREILAIYEREQSTMRIYAMQDVLKNLSAKVGFTSRGNMSIGRSIVVQRKGGNGVHSIHITKTDPRHPGNDIQIKMRMNLFEEEMRDKILAEYHV